MKKILVVDDEQDLRCMFMDVLKTAEFIPLTAADGLTAITMVKKESPDAVILDLRMPGMTGIETLKELKKTAPGLPVIVLTAYSDIAVAVDAMKLGAYDFLIKPPDFSSLFDILRKAAETPLNGVLSDRERETILWVKEGKSNFEIALLMGLSENTVRTYLKRIFVKLGVCSRAQAVSSAFESGMLQTYGPRV